MKFLKGLLTDSKDRPEIKAVLGLLAIAAAFVWLFWKGDVAGFAAIFGVGAGLLFGKTVEDIQLDKAA